MTSLPPINPTPQAFINELQTAILYASLIGNDGNVPKLCSVINPAALFKIEGINGTAVLNEVCGAAVVELQLPSVTTTLITENQLGVQLLSVALFAVQVAGGYAGGTNLATLCNEINETLLNNLFIGFIDKGGTAIKNYVCGAANSTSSCPCNSTTSANLHRRNLGRSKQLE